MAAELPGGRHHGVRRWTALIAVTVFCCAAMVMVPHRAEASPVQAVVTASAPAAAHPSPSRVRQTSIFCAMLLMLVDRLSETPFFNTLLPLLNELIQALGCAPSGA